MKANKHGHDWFTLNENKITQRMRDGVPIKNIASELGLTHKKLSNICTRYNLKARDVRRRNA